MQCLARVCQRQLILVFFCREMVFLEKALISDAAAHAETPAKGSFIKVWWTRIWCQVTFKYWGDGVCPAIVWWWNGIVSLWFWLNKNVSSFKLFVFVDSKMCITQHVNGISLWLPYVIGQAIIFLPWFLLSFFFSFCLFPRLISAVADWMSAILAHMVWP